MKLRTALTAAVLAMPGVSYANCPDGLADLQGDYIFTMESVNITNRVRGWSAAGVMTFDGLGGVTFPDAIDSTTPEGGRQVDIFATYRVYDPDHCAWRMDLVIGTQHYLMSLDGTDHLVGAVLVDNAFITLTGQLLHLQ